MTTWQAMAALEGLGYRFEITAEGKIRGTIEGTSPPEASALLEIVRHDRDVDQWKLTATPTASCDPAIPCRRWREVPGPGRRPGVAA